jgi:hypothetical protein
MIAAAIIAFPVSAGYRRYRSGDTSRCRAHTDAGRRAEKR